MLEIALGTESILILFVSHKKLLLHHRLVRTHPKVYVVDLSNSSLRKQHFAGALRDNGYLLNLGS